MRNIPPLLVSFGLLAVILGPCFLLYAWGVQGEFQKFLDEGKEATATISEKWTEGGGKSRTYNLQVSFFDKPLLEGGSLHMAEVEVLGGLWSDLEVEQEVIVLYIPENPDTEVILKKSTEPENFAPIERYSFGLYMSIIGFFMFVVGVVWVRINKKIG